MCWGIDGVRFWGLKWLPVAKGQFFALVDDEDFDRAAALTWHLHPTGYAAHSTDMGKDKRLIYLHRFLLGAPAGMCVDHLNGERLDCQKANLRLCTKRQNASNRQKRPDRQFKGVYPNGNGWRAAITINRQTRDLCLSDDPLVCARAYDVAAVEAFGEFAKINGVTDLSPKR